MEVFSGRCGTGGCRVPKYRRQEEKSRPFSSTPSPYRVIRQAARRYTPGVVLRGEGMLLYKAESAFGINDDGLGGFPNTSGSSMQKKKEDGWRRGWCLVRRAVTVRAELL